MQRRSIVLPSILLHPTGFGASTDKVPTNLSEAIAIERADSLPLTDFYAASTDLYELKDPSTFGGQAGRVQLPLKQCRVPPVMPLPVGLRPSATRSNSTAFVAPMGYARTGVLLPLPRVLAQGIGETQLRSSSQRVGKTHVTARSRPMRGLWQTNVARVLSVA
jgi:hypothetical protein